MRHVFALLVLLALLLFVMARNVSPDPYIYDEADYMFAASQGLWANYTDTPTLPIADFVRTGVARGRDSGARLALSEQIRASNDILFYRHWHGPLYLYCLIPISRAFANEQSVRMALLGISALTLIAIYAGCIWLMPGPRGSLAALLAGLLFASSNSVIRSTELAPHQLFALYFVCCLIFLAKAVDTARRAYWYAAVVFAAVAFCTLEIAFVVILSLAIAGFIERRSLNAHWPFLFKSALVFLGTVVALWPAAVFKLSLAKGYLFMAYLAVVRKAPWGNEGLFETWGTRIADSPLECAAILAALIVYFRVRPIPGKRFVYPMLMGAALMVLVTLRITNSTARYSLLFMPALDIFAALTLVPFFGGLSRRAICVTLVLGCGLTALNEYRIFERSTSPDPRLRSVLNVIRERSLENKALLVPQTDVPMLHYYFPAARLSGFLDQQPILSGENSRQPDAVLYPGYPVRLTLLR